VRSTSVEDGTPVAAEPAIAADTRDLAAVRALVAACEHRVAGRCGATPCRCETAGPTPLHQRPVQLQGSALARAALRLFGWRVDFDGLPARQGVMIVYPHTSNWDFPWGLLTKWAIGVPLAFWAKHTLFEVPLLGRFVRAVGGIPIDRRAVRGVVGQTVDRLREARASDEFLWLAIAPEGTRSRTEGWRSGFYQLALGADVPLALAYIDYGRKRIGVDSAWRLSGDAAADMACIAQRYAGRAARRPCDAAPVRLL
jgi:1-acyl-sn-glycerol-3-phosphate acyltransferase